MIFNTFSQNFVGGMTDALRCCVDLEQVTASDPRKHPYSGSLKAELFKPLRTGSRAYKMSSG